MRILYIHQYFATPRGRTGTRSYEQARAFRDAGHDVTVLTSSAQLRTEEVPCGLGRFRRGRIDGLDVVVAHRPYRQEMSHARRAAAFLGFMWDAARFLLAGPAFDLVFATSTPLSVGVPALVGKVLRGVPFVFEVRDLWPDVPRALGLIGPAPSAVLGSMEQAFYREARFVVAVNDDVAGRIEQKTGGRTQTVVVPNAADTDFFRPERSAEGFAEDIGLGGRLLCIHAGAMGPVNHLETVLDAAAVLRDREDVGFVLIGEGSRKEALRRRVERENLANVRILDGVPKQRLADILGSCGVGLMTVAPVPELEWNCANKFFDYLASGLPVVLNYGGWQARELESAGAGLAAPAGDSEAFAKAIRRIADDQPGRRAMSAAARRLAETAFERRAVLQPLLEALSRLEADLREH